MAPRKKTDLLSALPRSADGRVARPLLSAAERSALAALGLAARDQRLQLEPLEVLLQREAARCYVSRGLPGEPHKEVRSGPVKASFQ